ncbi:NADH-cytochrome b5 reductase-like [Anastrepha obliqua]|uniref:NADH-cytochrome b5 reductase-like n=1 Tax=Anastrepha obliqua TaxID=95512 RepID=UPI0024091193|nr:NADH-cytochrome b5 reductase-like [Anastrepha obliqua]XP_054728864.1 NADH-cytochrome b5 reductase-like [Anastrepha obliqua]
MDERTVANENDCCGNGCVNCVLDVGLRKSVAIDRLGKHNIISAYQKFRLLSKRPHNPKGEKSNNSEDDLPEVLELHFSVAELPNNASDYILEIPAGHHVMMRAILPSGLVWLRPYSPFWVDVLAMEFKILVNLAPNGPMSRFISSLQVGDSVEFRGPIGAPETITSRDTERHIFVITQGVAIAPTLRIVKEILENDEDFSKVVQLVCYRDLQHAFFRDTLREFNKYWNYTNRIYLAHQRCPSDMCKNTECSGKCAWFSKQLWYKEAVFLRRLNETDLIDVCKCVNEGTNLEFVIAGDKRFQKIVAEMVENSKVGFLEKNILLL